MPRRKEQKIVLSQLERCTDVYVALKSDPIFEGYDLGTLTISVKAKITPVIKNAARAANNAEHYLAANPSCCKEFEGISYVNKQTMAKMMRVSRSTFDKWLEDELIKPVSLATLQDKIDFYDPYYILEQLKNYKKQ